MPPMTLLGWFHTVMGVIAILTAAYALYQHRIIRAADKSGRAYLLITLVCLYRCHGFLWAKSSLLTTIELVKTFNEGIQVQIIKVVSQLASNQHADTVAYFLLVIFQINFGLSSGRT